MLDDDASSNSWLVVDFNLPQIDVYCLQLFKHFMVFEHRILLVFEHRFLGSFLLPFVVNIV